MIYDRINNYAFTIYLYMSFVCVRSAETSLCVLCELRVRVALLSPISDIISSEQCRGEIRMS